MEQVSIYDLLGKTQKKLTPVTIDQLSVDSAAQPMSMPGIYAKNTLSRQGVPDETRSFVPYRTLLPQTDYVFGADKEPLGKTDNSMLQSPEIGPNATQLPVWRGWRPDRPVLDTKDLTMQILEDQQGPGIESSIPQERETVVRAAASAEMPFPTLPDGMTITPEMPNTKGIYLESDHTVQEMSMSGMGDDITDAIGTVAKDVASAIQTKYGTNPAAIKAAAVAQSNIPWGTLLTVGVLGAAAIYFIPKLTK